METHAYKRVIGHEIGVDIHGATSERPLPAVVFIHGGGLVMGSRRQLLPIHVSKLNEAGFHVVSIDYRLAPESKLPEIIEDIKDAWTWLLQHGSAAGIDCDRMSVMGHSAGAYLALMSGFVVTPRPAAVVSIAGYGRLSAEEFSKPSQHYVSSYALAEEESARRFFTTRSRTHRLGERPVRLDATLHRSRTVLSVLAPKRHLAARDQRREIRRPRMAAGIRTSIQHLVGVSAHHAPPRRTRHRCVLRTVAASARLASHGVPNELLSDENWGHVFVYDFDKSVEEAFDRTVLFLQKYT